jgi:hypothetical protein
MLMAEGILVLKGRPVSLVDVGYDDGPTTLQKGLTMLKTTAEWNQEKSLERRQQIGYQGIGARSQHRRGAIFNGNTSSMIRPFFIVKTAG